MTPAELMDARYASDTDAVNAARATGDSVFWTPFPLEYGRSERVYVRVHNGHAYLLADDPERQAVGWVPMVVPGELFGATIERLREESGDGNPR